MKNGNKVLLSLELFLCDNFCWIIFICPCIWANDSKFHVTNALAEELACSFLRGKEKLSNARVLFVYHSSQKMWHKESNSCWDQHQNGQNKLLTFYTSKSNLLKGRNFVRHSHENNQLSKKLPSKRTRLSKLDKLICIKRVFNSYHLL